MGGPVDQVVAALEQAGYARVDQPQSVGGIPFQFDAMLAGRESLDLIAVVDLALRSDDGFIRRQVTALAQALDLVSSRRSLTIILTGPRRGTALVQAISNVARVLVVGTPGDRGQAELSDALAVLLPLEVAPHDNRATEPWARARQRLMKEHPGEVDTLVLAASHGDAAVRSALADLLSAPLDALSEDQTPNHETREQR